MDGNLEPQCGVNLPEKAEAESPVIAISPPKSAKKRRPQSDKSGAAPANFAQSSMRTRRPTRKNEFSKSPHSLISLISESHPTKCTLYLPALAQMHLHSFLCCSEVIGWLAGVCDSEELIVAKAFPVKAQIETENPNMNVEMDSLDAFEVQERIKMQGLQIVGWYHSHPKFESKPSILDIENQMKQQKTSEGKFIGAIVSPFWKDSLPLPPPCLFTVEEDLEHLSTFHHFPPCAVRYTLMGQVDAPSLLSELKSLAAEYLDHPQRVHLDALWRNGKTYENRIRTSAEGLVGAALAADICTAIKDIWGDTPAQSRKSRKVEQQVGR